MTVLNLDCRAGFALLPDNSVDAIVCDPPYELGFMGKSWDASGIAYDVTVWEHALRVLKPGGHLLAFSGSRTYHRMTCAIEDAGFEVRDQIMWVYGCLSEDSEVLTEDGWMPYNRAKQKNILAYDIQNDIYKWEKPSRWNEYRVKSDTAYRIQSDHTDQIVSRGHRCIVERGGMLEFVPADELSGVERVPYLQGDFSALPQGRGELLFQAVLREGKGLAQAALSERQGEETSRQGSCWGEKPGMEGRADLLQAQREVSGSGDQVCALSGEHDGHGAQGRVCDGASDCGGAGDWQAADSDGVRASHQSRCNGQQAGEPDAVCDQRGSQAVRARASYQTTVATVTAIEYSGLIWCPTVSTGAFVARRNGKVFITGNSGFPKSLDVSKAIDKAAGVEREVIGKGNGGMVRVNKRNAELGYRESNYEAAHTNDITAPATDAARQWSGWGTALKPAHEPICVARKPLIGTVAANVLQFGTGAINVDACRVGTDVVGWGGAKGGSDDPTQSKGRNYRLGEGDARPVEGRWPANLIHDGSDEVVALFPAQSGAAAPVRGTEASAASTGNITGVRKRVAGEFHGDTGSAARFFYCAKASKRDRNEGCEHIVPKQYSHDGRETSIDNAYQRNSSSSSNSHPTVKPTDLMRYLCRLVTPPGGLVVDPFAGSGSTGKAATLEGFQFIGFELSAEYAEIANARIAAASLT